MAIFLFLCAPTRIINCDGGLCSNLWDLFQYYIIITNYSQQIFSTDVFIYTYLVLGLILSSISNDQIVYCLILVSDYCYCFFPIHTLDVNVKPIPELSQMESQV